MVDAISADSIGWFMRKLEEDGRQRQASDTVVTYLRAHPISHHWGEGLFASSDMMSLEATRHLWSARLDPRRRTYAVGSYSHLLDQWPIIYDQPIVLNGRQVGAAIDGALRQRDVELEKLAADTHGFTYFGMTIAKLLGLDLCPQLRSQALRAARYRGAGRSGDGADPGPLCRVPKLRMSRPASRRALSLEVVRCPRRD